MPSITEEKVAQAVEILKELDIDCWLTFVRETTESGDPVLPLILGQALTWQSALLITREGERIAIVGKFDDAAVRSTGAWDEVISYVHGIRDPLLEVIGRFDPQKLAINYSRDDVKADGLSHGMHLLLADYLKDTPFANRLRSAGEVIRALRGRKTPAEIDRIRRAIATTEEIFTRVALDVRSGWTERQVSDFMHDEITRRRLEPAWEWDGCPIVTTGPDSMVGHGRPSDELCVRPGGIFHLDFGVREADYCADLQRCWFVAEDGNDALPEAVTRGFDAVRASITAAAEALRPGVEAWTVDAAARQALVEAGNVFTLELGIDNLDGRGYLGLEEMVLVTGTGIEWLSDPQTRLPQLSAR